MTSQQMDIFKNLTSMVDSVADLDNLLGLIVLAAMRVMNAKASSLLLTSKRSDKLYFHTCVGDKGDQVKKFELDEGEGIAGWAVQQGRPVLVTDVANDPRWSPKIADAINVDTKSIACAPLTYDNNVLGALEIIDRKDEKPLTQDDLDRLVVFSDLAAGLLVKAREYNEVNRENKLLRKELAGRHEIIGKSKPLLKAMEDCAKVASSKATALITGESGTGKELFARLIHDLSPRRDRRLVSVNCGALAETLLERELFGHEKGAFTGADTQKPGLFEAADSGTIFLDEIAETSPAMQIKLLRVLQEESFFRVGGQSQVTVDIRVIAATNKKLEKLVEEKKFRDDLFYRLNVINIALPPLREREGDIIILAEHFLRKFSRDMKRDVRGFTEESKRAMLAYPWPGNIRQLENTVERAIIMAESDMIGISDLPPEMTGFGKSPISVGLSLKEAQDHFRAEFVRKSLDRCDGNKTNTAKMLNIQRTYLSRLIKEYNIQ